MKVCVAGLGATGSLIARHLPSVGATEICLLDTDSSKLETVHRVVGDRVPVKAISSVDDASGCDVAVLATPVGTHVALVKKLMKLGCHVISLSDGLTEVQQLLGLNSDAVASGLSLVVGAGFTPGISCLLASMTAQEFDQVKTISVAKQGTGGPACARQHHRALKHHGLDWLNSEWQPKRGGSGRALVWFPDPIGAKDCYFAALPSSVLLQQHFPEVERISARIEANRRDRLTSSLPMLRPPHADGGPGAARVEVGGLINNEFFTAVTAVMEYPTFAASSLAATIVPMVFDGEAEVGASGLAGWKEPKKVLAKLLGQGIKVHRFDAY